MGTFTEKIKTIVEKYLLIIILVFGFSIRLLSINQSLWMDEAISAKVASDFSYSEIITKFIRSDTHPPLYYLILKLWTEIFGFSEISLRFPSVIFGMFTVLYVYKIGRLFDRKVALYSTFLAAFSPLLIYYSQEARMYSLTALLVCIMFYTYLKNKWISFSVSLLLLATTDYLPLLILAPLWFITLFDKNRRLKIKYFLIAHLPLITFGMVWYQTFIFQSSSTVKYLNNNSWWGDVLGKSGLKDLSLIWIKFIIGRINFIPIYLYALMVFLPSLIIVAGLFKSAKKFKEIQILWLWFLVPITLSFLMSLKLPGFSYFRLLFTLPAFILLISYGLSKLKMNSLGFFMLITFEIVFSLIYLFNNKYWREDWKTAVPLIENRIKESEYVFVAYPESFTPYEWYSKKVGKVKSLNKENLDLHRSLYTLDYIMDLTDPEKTFYRELNQLGFENTEVYNFRGVGQVRYWARNHYEIESY